MEVKWQISRKDVSRVRALVRQQANNALVRKRMANNLAKTKPQVRRKRFWFSMVSMDAAIFMMNDGDTWTDVPF